MEQTQTSMATPMAIQAKRSGYMLVEKDEMMRFRWEWLRESAVANGALRRWSSHPALWVWMLALGLGASVCLGQEEGARVVHYYGYDDCIELRNDDVRVVLCPAAGGRVLEYSLGGENILYLPPGNEGWTWDGGEGHSPMHAGRFDIGPEHIVAPRKTLWQGRWRGEITGARSARLTSQVDPGPGVYLVREFELAPSGSRLRCTQRIVNAADQPNELCHWSRTFAVGHGIVVVPTSRFSKFPQHWVRYDPPGRMINFDPQDSHVSRLSDCLVITDHPRNPKLGFDSREGWLAYLSPQGLMFVKEFACYPERAYNEVAGLTISVWYPDGDMVELEPIGPRERLEKAGDSAEFTETWYLGRYDFPSEAASVTLDAVLRAKENIR